MCPELSGRGAGLDPLHEIRAVARKLDDPVVAIARVTVAHEDVAVRRDQDVVRLVKAALGTTRHAGGAKSHQHVAVRAELDDLVSPVTLAAGIGDPHVAIVIHVDAVRPDEHPSPPPLEHVAVLVELEHDIEVVVPDTGVLATPIDRPDRLAVWGDLLKAGRTPIPSIRKRRPDREFGAGRVGRRVLRFHLRRGRAN